MFKAGTAEVVASHQKELKQIYPQEGWVEQDPHEIYDAVLLTIGKTIEKLESLGKKAVLLCRRAVMVALLF